MLIWCQEGRGRLRINGRWFDLEPEDFLLLPWQHEVLYHADASDPFSVAAIHLIPHHATDRKPVYAVSHQSGDHCSHITWRRDQLWPGLDGVRRGIARSSDPLRLLGTYIVERFDRGALGEAAMRTLAQLLIHEIAQAVTRREISTSGSQVVRRAQDYVESDLRRRISTHQLARLAGCSVATLRRHFQAALGMPPYDWILHVRLQRARRLLATTTLRVKEIAAQVGFADEFQFSRVFKQRTGRPPRVFRNENAFAPKPL